jgi:hypothetical protein
MVYEQRGMDCQLSGSGGPTTFQMKLAMKLAPNGDADCKERADTEEPCHKAWQPPSLTSSSPPAWALWNATFNLPKGVVVKKSPRSSDPGYGVDIVIHNRTVEARVWDDDGDGFFEVSYGSASCKVDVGSNGLGPGLQVLVYEQRGMDCQISGWGGPTFFQMKLAMKLAPNGDADCKERADTEEPCHKAWQPPSLTSAPPDWALWNATFELPKGAIVKKSQRSSDPGYGVDIVIISQTVEARVWDDDGDGFFEVAYGDASCKVDVGSNGLGPGLQVMVYEQRGMDCQISGSGGPTTFQMKLAMKLAPNGGSDCKERADTEDPCHKWQPPSLTAGGSSNTPIVLV